MSFRKRVDLDGIDTGSEPGRSDSHDPRAATKVQHSPGTGPWRERRQRF
jgi:hypothetical protein